METVTRARLMSLAAAFTLAACNRASETPPVPDVLVGAWRSQIKESDGELAEMKNLEFMYVFNVGGTMMEFSNYDSAPPRPAYVWRLAEDGGAAVRGEVRFLYNEAARGLRRGRQGRWVGPQRLRDSHREDHGGRGREVVQLNAGLHVVRRLRKGGKRRRCGNRGWPEDRLLAPF